MGESTANKILIVDDEPTILLALSRILTGPQTTVTTSEDLEEAKELLSLHSFDLVIADVRLSGIPGREGLELLSHVKEMSPETPVIIMTAFGSDEIRDDAYRRGASCYYEKPVDLLQLMSKIGSFGIMLPADNHAA